MTMEFSGRGHGFWSGSLGVNVHNGSACYEFTNPISKDKSYKEPLLNRMFW